MLAVVGERYVRPSGMAQEVGLGYLKPWTMMKFIKVDSISTLMPADCSFRELSGRILL